MSVSAPQSKMPSPARTPRVSTGDEKRPALANHPAGIVNMGMTCFLNSTFQALSATPALISLLAANPALPLRPVPTGLLPSPVQDARLTPCLCADVLEPPLYQLIPVTRAFTNSLHKAWTTKDRGGGTSGPGEGSSLHSMTLSPLLRELARKYDQYDEFAQQDAHELLRHLLDSMEMEEKDVIKRRGADSAAAAAAFVAVTTVDDDKPTSIANSGSNDDDPAESAAMFSPKNVLTTVARPASPSPALSSSAGATSTAAGGGPSAEQQQLVPFVDALFGGLLASVVVCETCKSVNHTYEGFLDISLSLRGSDDDAPRRRKRDRFRAMFKPASRGGGKVFPDTAATMSEPEGSDTERDRARKHAHYPSHLSASRDSDGESGPRRPGSSPAASRSLKASFSFKRKNGTRTPSTSRTPRGSSPGPPSASLPASLAPSLPSTGTTTPVPPHTGASPVNPAYLTDQLHQHINQAAPTPAQAAYIQRILYGPPAAPETADPLAKLHAAHVGGLTAANAKPAAGDYGLIDSLKIFTAVEVLEGDNAFACHKCWKIRNGRYNKRARRSAEVPIMTSTAASTPDSTPPLANDLPPPAIAVEDGADARLQVPLSPTAPSRRLGRLMSRHGKNIARAASPLRSVLGDRDKDTSDVSPRLLSSSPTSTVGTASTATATATGSTVTVASPRSAPQDIPENDGRQFDRFDTVGSTESGGGMTDNSMGSANSASGVGLGLSMSMTPAVNGSAPSVASVSVSSIGTGTGTDATRVDGADDDGCRPGDDTDGLSDSTDDDELPAAAYAHRGGGGLFRRPPRRQQSKHFVLRRAFKRYLIAQAPEVLVFHIKRFKQTSAGGMYSTFSTLKKMDDFVSFPETLNLAPFMAPNRTDFKCTRTASGALHAPFMDWTAPDHPPEAAPMPYRLYAVVVHKGTMVGGHYVAYVLVDPEKVFYAAGEWPSEGGSGTGAVEHAIATLSLNGDAGGEGKDKEKDRRMWCYCSDTEIRFASVDEVMSARAYMCFYDKFT